jgi:hypothetical protein
MAYYAFIDSNNVVVEVIPGRDEDEIVDGITDWEAYYSTKREGLRAVRTSYNTAGGVHTEGGTPFRKNYAGFGFVYDEERDAFIPPKPFDSWVLNEDTCQWDAPIPMPEVMGEDDRLVPYVWDEDAGDWIEVTNETP